MRGQTVGWTSLVAALGFLVSPAHSQAVSTAQNQTITIRGIFSGSLYYQDADFALGNGQQAEWPVAKRPARYGGDVRNMRLGLGINGPEVRRGWRANGTFEIDFFGGLSGPGAFGDEQPLPRLRLAYVDLTNGRTTLRFGQDWSLTLGNIPQSTSHVAFPLGYGPGGFISWRFPQFRLTTTLSRANAPMTTRLSVAILRNSWSDELVAQDVFNAGERGTPQIEGRVDISKRNWTAYLVAHVDSKDSVQTGPAAADTTDLSSWAIQAGFSTTRGDLSLQANAHIGKAMGHHFAQIIQFGDIKGWGGWAQLGYNLNPRWSIWGYYGTERPNESDINDPALRITDAGNGVIALANRRLKSWLFVPMIRYRSGPYSYGLEWLHSELQLQSGTNLAGNQIAASVRYDF